MARGKRISINNFRGLVTAAGQLGAPPGAFSQVDNFDIPNETLLEKRRGVENIYPAWGTTVTGIPMSLHWHPAMNSGAGALIAERLKAGATTTDFIYRLDTGAQILFPNAGGPAVEAQNMVASRMRSALFRGNLYLTTTRTGVARVESDGRAWFAGGPRARFSASGGYYAFSLTNPWLANNNSVAYRAVLAIRDADGTVIRGPPSGRLIVQNATGGSRSVVVAVSFPVPVGYQAPNPYDALGTASVEIELYRSSAVAISSGQPSDELQLAYVYRLSPAELQTTGFASLPDQTPDAALGASLYTNAISGGDTIIGGASAGLAASNHPPPLATDIAVFANRMWFAGLTGYPYIDVSIIAVGTTGTALKAGDVVTWAGSALTAVAEAATPGFRQFRVYVSGSLADNLRRTAMELAASADDGCSFVATYIGNPSSPAMAGKVRFHTIHPVYSGPYTLQVTTGGSGSAFVPDLTSARSTTTDVMRNQIAYSKENQPDAVPPVNYLTVGRGEAAIQRIIALRDALYIFATDGIWRITGSTVDNFSLERFDVTFHLLARDTVVELDDAIYAWGAEGIARITSGGVELIDESIRDIVTQQRIAGASTSFSVVDRIRKRVLFFLENHSSNANSTSAGNANRALVYHVRSGTWTRYDFGVTSTKTCAANMAPSNSVQIVLGTADDGTGTATAGTEADGPGYTRAVGTHNGKIQGERMTNGSGLLDPTDWADTNNAGSAVGITSLARWTNVVPSPAEVAQWCEVHAYFSPSDVVAAMAATPTAITFGTKTEMTTRQTLSATPALSTQCRAMVSRDAARGARMTVDIQHTAQEYLGISGFAVVYEADGTEVSR